jgi:hypothetical protein
MSFSKTALVGLVWAELLALSGCATKVPLIADSHWHTVYAIQVQNVENEIQLEMSRRKGEEGCSCQATGSKTAIRLINVEPFRNYDSLPDTVPAPDPSASLYKDFGPQDMSLSGAKRVVLMRVVSVAGEPSAPGREILVRTNDPCAMLSYRVIKHKAKNAK